MGGLILGVVICEIVLRLCCPQTLYSFEQHTFQPSTECGYILTPGVEKIHSQPEFTYTIKSNKLGFRGTEPNFNAEFKVLILGDSFGMGQGVPEGKNLCELAQTALNKEKKGVSLFNTALSAYSGINQIGVLKKFLLPFNPKLVVVLLHGSDIGVTESLQVENGFLVMKCGNPRTAAIREWLNNHSHLYCLIKKLKYKYQDKAQIVSYTGNFTPEALQITYNNLTKMKDLCSEINASFHVVLLPDPNASLPVIQEFKKNFHALLSQNNFKYSDWEDVFPIEKRQKMIFPIDQHWTESGHQFFSQHLIRIIEEYMAPQVQSEIKDN